MEIRTERLLLKPVEMDYIDSMYEYSSDYENTKLMMYLPVASMEEMEQGVRASIAEWKKEQPHRLTFVLLKDGGCIGEVILFFLENREEAELGWILSKDHWGRGYTVEAAREVAEYARTRWNVRRIIACCDSENTASQRVMEKLGMVCVDKNGRRTNRSMGDEQRVEWTYEMRF